MAGLPFKFLRPRKLTFEPKEHEMEESNWIEVRKSDYFKIADGHKWYRCPNCQDYLLPVDKQCIWCDSFVQWIEDDDQVEVIVTRPVFVKLVVIHKKHFAIIDGEKRYICPNCNSDLISPLHESCPNCEFTIKWKE